MSVENENGAQAPLPLRQMTKGEIWTPAHQMKLWQKKPKIFLADTFDWTPDSWQEDVIEMYLTHQRIGLIASKGPGKMEDCDTEIYTPDGKRRFGDLKAGDYVFSEYGVPTLVTAIHPQGKLDLYRVTFDDGTFADVGLEHLWKVRLKGKMTVLSTEQMMDIGVVTMQGSQKYRHFQLPQQGPAQFPTKDLPVHPYLLGVWIGDGSKAKSVYTSPDEEIEARINSLGYSTTRHSSPDRCTNIYITRTKSLFAKTETFFKKSYERFIPELYKTASVEQRKELLYGLMDTDGTIDKRDGSIEYSTTSPQLADDVAWLVRSLGGKSTIKTKRAYLNGVEHRLCYRVRVTLNFNPFQLKRKAVYWHAPTQLRYLCRTVVSIEKVEAKEAMCISVACPNHCYLTKDFIVTHNTGLIAALTWHFFLTNRTPKIGCLSVTESNLKANLWAELLMLRSKSEFAKRASKDGAQRITLVGHEGYSFIDARSYSKTADAREQASALAGLHADNVMFAIDEGGTIPDAIYATADAALSTGDSPTKKAKILTAANPEVPSGTLYRAAMGKSIQKWGIYKISGDPDDPKRAPRVSKTWAQELIDQFGRDNPWVMVNVLAQYPKTAVDTLLSEEEVHQAMNRTLPDKEVRTSQHRLGVDVARGGIDNTALVRRRGLKVYPIELAPSSLDGPELAGLIQLSIRDNGVERVFIDNTGGYGSSALDALRRANSMIDVSPVVYNARAQQNKIYFNKRTEMWVRMRDYIRNGGCLPNDPYLMEELCGAKVYFHGGVLRLEEKDQIKIRIGRSPDRADALAQTFADVEAQSDKYYPQDNNDDPYAPYQPPNGRHLSDSYSQNNSGNHLA